MNLFGLANSAIQIVNPNFVGTWRKSTGWTTDANYKRTPAFSDTPDVAMQVQALQGDDLKHLDALNVQGVMRAIYVAADLSAVNRAGSTGGDILLITTGLSGAATDAWLVTQVLEPWDGQWTKTACTLQLSNPA